MADGGGLPMIYDLSFVGASISINENKIVDFMDDANPIDVSQTRISEPEFSCNGAMFRCARPNPIIVSVTVIPMSASDKYLQGLYKDSFNQGKGTTSKQIKLDVTFPDGTSFEFYYGMFVSGVYGVSAAGTGKLRGNTYTFAFARIL